MASFRKSTMSEYYIGFVNSWAAEKESCYTLSWPWAVGHFSVLNRFIWRIMFGAKIIIFDGFSRWIMDMLCFSFVFFLSRRHLSSIGCRYILERESIPFYSELYSPFFFFLSAIKSYILNSCYRNYIHMPSHRILSPALRPPYNRPEWNAIFSGARIPSGDDEAIHVNQNMPHRLSVLGVSLTFNLIVDRKLFYSVGHLNFAGGHRIFTRTCTRTRTQTPAHIHVHIHVD